MGRAAFFPGGKMQQQFRMRKNGQFQRVYKKGKPAAAREISLLYLKGPRLLVGFSVSRKVGKAVVRNKVRRRLRECFRPLMGDVKNGLYVVVARPAAAEAAFDALEKDVRYLLRKHGALKTPEAQEGNRAR